MGKSQDWQIISYDVWGNEKDGWDVNAAYATGQYIALPADFTKKQLLSALRRAGLIKPRLRSSRIGIESHERDIYISDNKTGRPEFALRLELEPNRRKRVSRNKKRTSRRAR